MREWPINPAVLQRRRKASGDEAVGSSAIGALRIARPRTIAISEVRTISDFRFRFRASSLTVISPGTTSSIRIDVPDRFAVLKLHGGTVSAQSPGPVRDPALEGCRFRVDSSLGVIHLTGRVHWDLQRDLAITTLKRIDGVKKVNSNLLL